MKEILVILCSFITLISTQGSSRETVVIPPRGTGPEEIIEETVCVQRDTRKSIALQFNLDEMGQTDGATISRCFLKYDC